MRYEKQQDVEGSRLPEGKALVKSDVEYDPVLIDATETPIERPKTKMIVLRKKDDISSH